jgi:hypothetical protein
MTMRPLDDTLAGVGVGAVDDVHPDAAVGVDRVLHAYSVPVAVPNGQEIDLEYYQPPYLCVLGPYAHYVVFRQRNRNPRFRHNPSLQLLRLASDTDGVRVSS